MRTSPGRGSGARPWLPPILTAVAVVAIAAVAGAVVGDRPIAGHAEPLEGYTYSFDVVGSIEVRDPSSLGYEDVSEGAQVEIVNQSQEVLAVGYLEATATPGYFEFSVPDVPRGEDMYGAKIGNESRGVIWQDERETATLGFTLTLGG